jgi:Tfp pilus assembly protein PilX
MLIRSKQNGSTLLVGMIMLILLTLIAVSAIESTMSSVQMVGNAQFREEATAAAQQAVENVISSTAFTTSTPAAQGIDINADGTTDYTVTFAAPVCNSYKAVNPAIEDVPKACNSGTAIPITCYRTTWDIPVEVNDPKTGAKVNLHQGVKVLIGFDVALDPCGI